MLDGALLNLELENAEDNSVAGLILQPEINTPPVYSEVFYRLYLIESDETEILLEGQSTKVHKGQLLTLSPGERIEFMPDAKALSSAFHHNFFCVRVMRNEVFCDGVVFNRLRGLPIVNLPGYELEIVRSRFQELAYIMGDKSLFKPEHAINVLRSLLLQAADCKIRFSKEGDALQINSAKMSPLVARFQDLIEQHYADHLDVAQYCDMLGVTVATLNRHVKKELNQTPKQVAQERLAIEARVALRSGERSVKDVAIDLGFDDPLYFSRFFRKQFGAAPTQYFAGYQE